MNWRKARMATAVAAGLLLTGTVTGPAHAVTACTEAALRTDIAAGGIVDLTPYCVYTLTDALGQIAVSTPVTIHGNNATIRRDLNATTQYRIFEVFSVSLTMDTLTLMNGVGVLDDGGGAVLLVADDGSLTTTNVNFQGNTSLTEGGAILASSAASNTVISLTGGTISDNRALGSGGGVADLANTSTTSLNSVTLTRNRALSGGGVLINGNGALTIAGSTISNNTGASRGGGILHLGSTGASVDISSSKITDNRASSSSGGGGGIALEESDSTNAVTITNSTIGGNTISGFGADGAFGGRGGGIHQRGGQLILDSTKVTGNQTIGAVGLGAGISSSGNSSTATLTLQNGTTVTGNLASGRYSKGGGLHTTNGGNPLTVSVTASNINTNKVTGTGSVAGGVFNVDSTYSFTTSTVNNNIAPIAPAPGGVSTGVAITSVDGATTFTGNTPTNCLLSPAAVTNCVG